MIRLRKIQVLSEKCLRIKHTVVPAARIMNYSQQSAINVDAQDVQRHATLAKDWWNISGPLKSLHAMNQIRVPFIRDGLISTGLANREYINSTKPLKGLHLLDVGCGGGILTEQLARIHATMTSIDPGNEVIKIAQEHCSANKDLASRITYRNETIETHRLENKEKYDGVVVSEVIEHVVDKPKFLEACLDTLKPGGSIFITTFNKTFLSWLGGIIIAENVINAIPKGTHDWNQFIAPIDMTRLLNLYDCNTVMVNGFTYEFWRNSFRWTKNNDISYALQAVKSKKIDGS